MLKKGGTNTKMLVIIFQTNYICKLMKERELLEKYLPSNSVETVLNQIIKHGVHLRIAKKRNTKFGDYRPPGSLNPNHRISINYNLNQYSFLITFTHELAHLLVWEAHRNKVSPHGKEWKEQYRQLMMPLLNKKIFPEDLRKVLSTSIINSKASSSSDLKLSRILKKYDPENEEIYLENIAINSMFKTEKGIVYIKGEKRRTRYICINTQNNKKYLFHPLTPVIELDQ